MPDVNPMAAFIQTLMGNTASVIGETPEYRERAQKDLGDQRTALLAARSQNLAALQRNYDQQATAAAQAGDMLAEAKLRSSSEKVAKANALIMEQVHHQNATDLEKERQRGDVETTKLRGEYGLREAEIRARHAGTAQADSDLKALYAGLPSSTGYQTTVRMLGSHVASAKVNTEEAAKTLAVARSLALERNKADRTPEQYAARIKRFNNMVKQLRGKDKGKWWKQILKQDPAAADTISVEEGIAAAREQFPPWELEMMRGNSKTK
jgi:hypothetical protein